MTHCFSSVLCERENVVCLCVCMCTLWAHVCWYVMWFKTNGKKLKVPEPSFKLRQILFKKTWMFSWTFGVCFFHINTVSKNLGEELKTTNAGHFIRYFKTCWFTVIQLVVDCLVAPRVTNRFISQQLTWRVHFVTHSWNIEFK